MVMEDMNYLIHKNTLRLSSKRLASLRELQSATGMISASGEELRLLFGLTPTSSLAKHPERASVASGMPSILDKAFKGEL
jgi:hypothetical protein